MKVEIRDSKLHLSGYVNAVERDSKVITTKRGKCVEQIAAGAFAASMADGHEVRMKLNHKRDIGSTADGVLSLKEDNIGLYAEAETDDEELMTLAGKGELRGWSFGFVAKDDELESRDGKEPRRRVKALDLQEVSILSVTPAYNGTSVEVRSYEQYSDTVEAYRDDEGNIIDLTVSHRESDANGSTETTTYTDGRGTSTDTVTSTHTYKADAQALKNTIAQLRMKGYILEKRAEQRELEERYNPYHDPKNGRFTNAGYGGGIGALYVPKGYKGKGVIVGATSDLSPVAQIAAKLTTPLKMKDLGGLPELSGSSSEISEAKRIRNEKGKYLQNYVATKGGTASAEITRNYINGTSKEKAQFVLQQAEKMTFGNSSLLPDKIKSEIATQKEYADRYSRFTELITRHKSASWWTGQGNTIVSTVAMKDYIDGKGWNEAILGKRI